MHKTLATANVVCGRSKTPVLENLKIRKNPGKVCNLESAGALRVKHYYCVDVWALLCRGEGLQSYQYHGKLHQ